MAAFWDIASCSLVELTDVSDMRTVSIIKGVIVLMMEAYDDKFQRSFYLLSPVRKSMTRRQAQAATAVKSTVDSG
jgi:hypothetical protein